MQTNVNPCNEMNPQLRVYLENASKEFIQILKCCFQNSIYFSDKISYNNKRNSFIFMLCQQQFVQSMIRKGSTFGFKIQY